MMAAPRACRALAALAGALLVASACAGSSISISTSTSTSADACSGREVSVAFFADFEPVSYAADLDPLSEGFNTHRGYEADLLDAVEATDRGGLSFTRRGVAEWDGVWLKPATEQHDLAGGGITILDSRTAGADGRPAVAFTSGHIIFRQSLLVRAADADRLAQFSDLTQDTTVGVFPATTGEARLLQLTGIAGDGGVLAEGTRVETPAGVVVADGSGEYAITAARTSASLADRRSLAPPSPSQPQVVFLSEASGEPEIVEALTSGAVDAVAQNQIGNLDIADKSAGALAVSALDPAVEHGGFTVAADDEELRACLDERIDHLTDNRRIGIGEWLEDPDVFARRAETWNPGA